MSEKISLDSSEYAYFFHIPLNLRICVRTNSYYRPNKAYSC